MKIAGHLGGKLRTIIEENRLGQYGLTAVAVLGLLVGFYYLLFVLKPFDQFGVRETAVSYTQYAIAAQGNGWELYFTNPQPAYDVGNLDGTLAGALIEHIDQAQASIHVAAFELDLVAVAEALARAHQRGVEVLLVTDDEHGLEGNPAIVALLTQAGIPVKDDRRNELMHNKFWIFDGKMVWTGSTNMTENGNFANNNNAVVLNLPPVAALFEQEFAEMWAGAFGPNSPAGMANQPLSLGDLEVEVLFAPEDKVMERLVTLVNAAENSVEVMAFLFTHDDLGTAVLNRAATGVDIRAIFETRSSETTYSELPPLYCAGLNVRQDGNLATFHHKVIIIDGETVVTGSLNFTENADEHNDENVAILHNAEIAALYQQEFERRWAEAKIPAVAEINCP